jgi:hypothetical protein
MALPGGRLAPHGSAVAWCGSCVPCPRSSQAWGRGPARRSKGGPQAIDASQCRSRTPSSGPSRHGCHARPPHHRQPIPGEDPRDGHHQLVAIGRHSLQERLRSGLHVAVHEHCSVMAHDADGHAAGMQVDTTIKLMVVGVESPGVSSVVTLHFPGAAFHCGMLRRRPQLLSL